MSELEDDDVFEGNRTQQILPEILPRRLQQSPQGMLKQKVTIRTHKPKYEVSNGGFGLSSEEKSILEKAANTQQTIRDTEDKSPKRISRRESKRCEPNISMRGLRDQSQISPDDSDFGEEPSWVLDGA